MVSILKTVVFMTNYYYAYHNSIHKNCVDRERKICSLLFGKNIALAD